MRAIRVGMLNTAWLTLHATRLVSSLAVTANSMSVSAAPASARISGWAALPATVRRSKRVLQVLQAVGAGIDDGDVVLLRDQAFGHAGADLAGAENEDLQGRGNPSG